MSRILNIFSISLKTGNRFILKNPIKLTKLVKRDFSGLNSSKLLKRPTNNLIPFKEKFRALNSFTRGVQFKNKNLSKILLFSSLGIGLGSAGHICLKDTYLNEEQLQNLFESFVGLFIQFAECEKQNRRTDKYEETIGTKSEKNKDPVFDWKEFASLIAKEKFYFLAAIVVSELSQINLLGSINF